jgi:hypothetical protein
VSGNASDSRSEWTRLDRLELLRRSAALALASSPLAAALTACDSGSEETPTLSAGFLDWILRLHPAIEESVGPSYATEHTMSAVVRRGASTSQLVSDARDGRSEWDVFVGITPFLDVAELVEERAIVPWDDVAPPAVLDDVHPVVRGESSFDGKLYSWPFLLDVVVQAWNVDFVARAGLDPGRPPATWDEYLENARTVQRTGAAPYGCTLDPRGWRSLVPIAYTFDTDVYTEDGLFDYTHDAVVEALEIERRMVELANPDVLDPSTTAGSGATTDEGAFASQLVGYYVKYANSPIRGANTWPDPGRLALSSVPGLQDDGGVLFWTTGLALPAHGRSRRAAAGYAEALSYDRRVWRDSIATGRQSAGQIPGFRSLWAEWRSEEPEWVPEWATRTFLELRRGVPIRPHRLGARQFTIAQPYLDRYLTGEEKSARRVLRQALAEVRKAAG